MVNFYILIIFLFWIISILGYGSILIFFYKSPRLTEINNFKNIRIAVFGIFGLAVISLLGNLANFFIPLSFTFSIIVLFTGIILFAVNFKKIFYGYGKGEIILIIVLLVYLSFIPFNWAEYYDVGYYYLQSIKWLRESIVPFGLANLFGILGYNPSWFTVSAIVETPLFIKESPLFITNALIMFFYGSAVFLSFLDKIRFKKILFSDYFLILTSIPWFIRTRSTMASMSPDLPVMLIVLFITYLLIRGFEEKENNYFYFFTSIVISAFVVTVRVSSIPILIGSLLAFLYYGIFIKKTFYLTNSGKSIFKDRVFYGNLFIPSFMLLVTWLVRGIIMSGNIVYPSQIGRLKFLLWSANPGTDLKYIKSWARGGARALKSGILEDWNWFLPWVNKFLKSGDKIILLILIAGLLLLLAAVIRKSFSKNNGHYSPFFIPLFVSFSGILFWFFSAPQPRYAYGFLFGFALLIFSYALYVFKLPKYENILKLAFIFIIILFLLVEIIPLNVGIDKIFTNDWRKLPEVEVKEELTSQGIKMNLPVEGDQCWYMDLPATPHLRPDLKIILSEDGRYKMFYRSK